MKLFNVLNTADDKTTSGISWLEALEKQLGKKLPKYSNGMEMVGGHMSSYSGRSHSLNTEYIAYIPNLLMKIKIIMILLKWNMDIMQIIEM